MTAHPYAMAALAALGWLMLILMLRDVYAHDRAAKEWRPDARGRARGGDSGDGAGDGGGL